ncbi:MAG TPA: tRNA epoxyqueuosine(34) reductase QueG [Longimicrobiales bacterium]|nr:tRNA epoxyqueuosine(34) reductase QueG [Longimicrobiales bacterium]
MTRDAGREAPAARGGAGASARMDAPTAGGASTLSDAVRRRARELGFGLVGITTPDPSEHMDFYRRWLADGRHGGMAYLERSDAVARRDDLCATLPGVRSVIVVGHEYYQEDPPGVPGDPSRGVIARYARGRDYHKVVKKKLTVLGRSLEAGVRDGRGAADAPPASASPPPVAWRAYVDTGPILERDLARRAGLGWLGKNTMLINPRKGSYFFLGVLLTDLELDTDPPFEADHCGTCRACLDACPTGALLGRDAEGAPVMDARRCISYLTIEHREEIPPDLRTPMGNRVYGCDICQEVCPWNVRFAEVAAERDYAARASWEAEWDADQQSGDVSPESPGDAVSDGESEPGAPALIPTTDGPSLVDLMKLDEPEWDAFTRGSAMRRAGYGGLRRDVAIAIGNWLATGGAPDPDAVGELVAALSDEDTTVAEAAAWALGQGRRGGG